MMSTSLTSACTETLGSDVVGAKDSRCITIGRLVVVGRGVEPVLLNLI